MEINVIEISGFATALKGLRLPYKLWERSIIKTDYDTGVYSVCNTSKPFEEQPIAGNYVSAEFICSIDDRDLKLLQSLILKGDEHAKVMRFVTVSFEIKAPRYFWQEFDTYRNVEKISESTIHTILKEGNIDYDKFSSTTGTFVIDEFNKTIKASKEYIADNRVLLATIKSCLPEGYLQKRIVQTNYQTLRRMYLQRCNHKLQDWKEFCSWIEQLPMSNLITGKDGK